MLAVQITLTVVLPNAQRLFREFSRFAGDSIYNQIYNCSLGKFTRRLRCSINRPFLDDLEAALVQDHPASICEVLDCLARVLGIEEEDHPADATDDKGTDEEWLLGARNLSVSLVRLTSVFEFLNPVELREFDQILDFGNESATVFEFCDTFTDRVNVVHKVLNHLNLGIPLSEVSCEAIAAELARQREEERHARRRAESLSDAFGIPGPLFWDADPFESTVCM
jgi:hypothetical protein